MFFKKFINLKSCGMIKTYEAGYPCKLTKDSTVVLGRIIGLHENGSWGEVDGRRVYSTSLFSAPDGRLFKTGSKHLEELSKQERLKLRTQEIASNENLYGGKISLRRIVEGNMLVAN